MTRRLTFLLLTLAALLIGRVASGEDYYSQEKCSLCHIRQSVFFDPKFAGSDRIREYGEERLCASCHNGAVQDSRAVLWRGSQHPAPAAGKRCTRCHTPHSKGGWNVLAGTSFTLKRGGDTVCVGCHKQYASGGGGLHLKRFAQGGCQECHQAHGGVGKALLREDKEALCMRCHATVVNAGGHPVSRQGGARAGGKSLPECTVCHPVHRREGKAVSAAALCADCHAFARKKARAGGKPHPGEENCLNCHSFHVKSGDMGKKFRGKEIRSDILCARCHDEVRASNLREAHEKGTHVTSTSGGKEDLCFRCHRIHEKEPVTAHLVSGKPYFCLQCHEEQNTIKETGGIDLSHPVFERVAKGRLAKAVRAGKLKLGPSGEIVCETCHAVHGASIKTPLLSKGSEESESCFWCHENMRGKKHVPAKGKEVRCATCHPIHGRKNLGEDPWRVVCTECHQRNSVHRPGRVDGAATTPQGMPGFDPRGRKVLIGTISCPTCHDPHGGKSRLKGLRKEYLSSGFLCTACHREKETVALTPHDLRGIEGKSICEPCHLPHDGTTPWMLGLTVGTGERVEQACRSCHKEKGMGSPSPEGGHPVNMIVSRPLPGNYPLFGERSERQHAGALVCATCHEVHGTGLLPTGRGTEKLLRGEPCLPCHAERTTTHGKADCQTCHPPHRKKGLSETCSSCHEVTGNGIAGVHAGAGKGCESCHRIHSSKGTRQDAEALCIGCHAREGRVAGTKHAGQGGGTCNPCHPPHADPGGPAVKVRLGEERFVADAPCYRCHRVGGKGPVPKWPEHPMKRSKVPTSYGATVVLETPILMTGTAKDGSRPLFPLFDDKGVPSLAGRMGCLTCHDPHAGSAGRDDGSRKISAKYLRDASGVFLSDVCGACHGNKTDDHVKKFHEIPRKTE